MRFTTAFSLLIATALALPSEQLPTSASCPLKLVAAYGGVDCVLQPGNAARGQKIPVVDSLTRRANTVQCFTKVGNDYWFGVRSSKGACYVSEGDLADGENCRRKNKLPAC